MNYLVFPILRLLSDSQYHSTLSISSRFNCSTNDICKALNDIAALGIELSARNNYYRWEAPVQWLDSRLILKESGFSEAYYDVIVLNVTESTNNFLLNRYKANYSVEQRNLEKISVVAAELQTGGRGRLNRRWYSGLGDSLTFSIGCWFNQNISALTGLSLVIGMAILRTLNYFSIFNAHLKWPNDIVSDAHYHKLAGVLVDFRSISNCLSYVVIGIGVNFNLSSIVRAHIDHSVTDLYSLAGRKINRNSFCGILLAKLHQILIDFEKYGFNYFKDEWINSHAFEGKSVYLTLPDHSVLEGVVRGIGEDGSLCLLIKESLKSFHVGDVSIRIKHDSIESIGD